MAPRSTWRGAIEILGFPVHVALYPRKQEAKDLSFKYLIGNRPAKQVYISEADFEKREQAAKPKSLKLATWTQSECAKGVAVAGDAFKAIPPKKIDEIKDVDRTRVAEPVRYVPLENIDLELAVQCYVVAPDDKVAGAHDSVEQAWNGLLDAKRAYTSVVATRAGSRDLILVVYARRHGLFAATMPFESEIKEVPEFTLERDAKQGKRLAGFILSDEELVGKYDQSLYVSSSRAVRQKAIDAVLGGKEPPKPKEPKKPKKGANDLMANLEAAVKAKKPGKRRTGRKIPAKA